MSKLTDDRLDPKALAERALSNAAVASQHHIIDQGHEQADEVLCEALILNIEQAINLALRAAASTSTEGAGVIEQCLKALEPMLDLQTSETAPAELDDEEADCWVRGHNSAIDEAIAAIRALIPPAPKVTTDEAEERG